MRTDGNLVVTADSAREAQETLQERISRQLTTILEFPGYKEWKNKQIVQTLLHGHIPDIEHESLADFAFPDELQKQIDLVQGYHAILSTIFSIRECEFYFRRYPFQGRNVSREAHLRTCCELFLSRVYQFRERWVRQLKWLDRRTKPKGLPITALEQEFERRFGTLLARRHKVHHEEDYSDIQTQAIGLGDLLSVANNTPDWLRISNANYLRIRRNWVANVRATADQLDLFVGVVAVLMLQRCHFLAAETDKH